MRTPRSLPPAGILILALLQGCNGKEASPPGGEAAGAIPSAPPSARSREAHAAGGSADGAAATGRPESVLAASTMPARATLRLASHLFVDRDVAVYTRRAGVVQSVLARRGDRVKQGDLLCELESGDLRLRLELARLEAEKSEAEFTRARGLHEVHAISEEEYEAADYRRRSAAREVEMAAHELEKASVRAPFDGTVSSREVEVGQVLFEEDTRLLFRVTATGPLLARLHLPQWTFAHVAPGDPVSIHPPVSSPGPLQGKVAWVNDVLDPAAGSAEILVAVERSAERILRPGMEVDVELALSLPAGHLTVPREAVRLAVEGGSRGEVLLLEEGRQVPRAVKLGFLGDDRVEILSGLSEGEHVILPVVRTR